MGVSIASLRCNTQEFKHVHIYVIDSGINERNKTRIESIVNKVESFSITWLKSIDITKELSLDVSIDRGSVAQYARLFISRLVPASVERILYLDCDVLIVRPIMDLWKMGLDNNIIGGLLDAFGEKYRRNLGLKQNSAMFNSGVMLIDVNQWRSKNIEKKLLRFIVSHHGVVQQGDQGVLNAVLSNSLKAMDPRYNAVTIMFDFTYLELLTYRKPVNYYSEDEIEKAVKAPVIIHFTSSFLSNRPWEIGCNHPYVDVWLSYRNMTPWKNNTLRKDKKDWKVRWYRWVGRIIPRPIFLMISGILQAYLRPLIFRLKK